MFTSGVLLHRIMPCRGAEVLCGCLCSRERSAGCLCDASAAVFRASRRARCLPSSPASKQGVGSAPDQERADQAGVGVSHQIDGRPVIWAPSSKISAKAASLAPQLASTSQLPANCRVALPAPAMAQPARRLGPGLRCNPLKPHLYSQSLAEGSLAEGPAAAGTRKR